MVKRAVIPVATAVLALAGGYGIAYAINDQDLAWLPIGIAAVAAAGVLLRAAARSEGGIVGGASLFVLLLIPTIILAFLLLVGFLAIECQVFDNCPFS
jgi:hypothetical protein